MPESLLHWLWHRIDPTNMLLIEHQRSLLELLARMVPLPVALLERFAHIRWQLRDGVFATLHIERDARGRANKHQFLESLRLTGRIRAPKHATPALTQEVESPFTEL